MPNAPKRAETAQGAHRIISCVSALAEQSNAAVGGSTLISGGILRGALADLAAAWGVSLGVASRIRQEAVRAGLLVPVGENRYRLTELSEKAIAARWPSRQDAQPARLDSSPRTLSQRKPGPPVGVFRKGGVSGEVGIEAGDGHLSGIPIINSGTGRKKEVPPHTPPKKERTHPQDLAIGDSSRSMGARAGAHARCNPDAIPAIESLIRQSACEALAEAGNSARYPFAQALPAFLAHHGARVEPSPPGRWIDIRGSLGSVPFVISISPSGYSQARLREISTVNGGSVRSVLLWNSTSPLTIPKEVDLVLGTRDLRSVPSTELWKLVTWAGRTLGAPCPPQSRYGEQAAKQARARLTEGTPMELLRTAVLGAERRILNGDTFPMLRNLVHVWSGQGVVMYSAVAAAPASRPATTPDSIEDAIADDAVWKERQKRAEMLE